MLMAKTKTKKTTKKSSRQPKKQGFIFIAIGILLLIVGSVFAGYELHTWQEQQAAAPDNARLARITSIYKSLNLGPDYQLQTSSIFGDKRVYSSDSGRTHASSQTYQRGAAVNVTAADLRKSIEAAGFAFYDKPNYGPQIIEEHFKSANNEYVRMSVTSKPRDDAFRDQMLMGNSSDLSAARAIDVNAGPSNVTIEVNLDDNNG